MFSEDQGFFGALAHVFRGPKTLDPSLCFRGLEFLDLGSCFSKDQPRTCEEHIRTIKNIQIYSRELSYFNFKFLLGNINK